MRTAGRRRCGGRGPAWRLPGARLALPEQPAPDAHAWPPTCTVLRPLQCHNKRANGRGAENRATRFCSLTCSPMTPNARKPTQASPPASPKRRVSCDDIQSVESACRRRRWSPLACSAARSASLTLPPAGAAEGGAGSAAACCGCCSGSAWHRVRRGAAARGDGGGGVEVGRERQRRRSCRQWRRRHQCVPIRCVAGSLYSPLREVCALAVRAATSCLSRAAGAGAVQPAGATVLDCIVVCTSQASQSRRGRSFWEFSTSQLDPAGQQLKTLWPAATRSSRGNHCRNGSDAPTAIRAQVVNLTETGAL